MLLFLFSPFFWLQKYIQHSKQWLIAFPNNLQVERLDWHAVMFLMKCEVFLKALKNCIECLIYLFKQKILGNKPRNPIVNNIRHSNTGSRRVFFDLVHSAMLRCRSVYNWFKSLLYCCIIHLLKPLSARWKPATYSCGCISHCWRSNYLCSSFDQCPVSPQRIITKSDIHVWAVRK